MNKKQVDELVLEHIREYKSQRAAAAALGYSLTYIHSVLHKERAVSENLARACGFVCSRVETWERAEK